MNTLRNNKSIGENSKVVFVKGHYTGRNGVCVSRDKKFCYIEVENDFGTKEKVCISLAEINTFLKLS